MSLYRRLLGAALDQLPESLRAFHDAPETGQARGSFRVEHPAGRSARALGRWLRLPGPSECSEVALSVEVEGHRERWVRSFDGRRLVTVQEERRGRLVERYGILRFDYAVTVVEGSLVYDLVGARLLGVPLPRALRPLDRTVERGTADGWEVVVEVTLPILGRLLRYGGRLRWEPAAARPAR